MAAIGGLVPLGGATANWVKSNYAAGPSWVDLGTYPDKSGNDKFYGFFFNVNVKSLVWYVPENFEVGGYEVPKTMEELFALSDQIVKDGGHDLFVIVTFAEGGQIEGDEDLHTTDATRLKGMPTELIVEYQRQLRYRGVDIMSSTGGVVSAVHTQQDVEQATTAFEETVTALRKQKLVRTM